MADLRIEPEEARKMKDALFVDARNPQAWGSATTKIPGAVRVPAMRATVADEMRGIALTTGRPIRASACRGWQPAP